MAADNKKTKTDTAPKESTTASKESTTTKVESPTTKDAAPANYSRGEGQKPVTAAYRENWNAIFAKKGRQSVSKKKR